MELFYNKVKSPALITVFSFETCPPMICSVLLGWLSLALVRLGISKHSGHMPKQERFLCLEVREKEHVDKFANTNTHIHKTRKVLFAAYAP